MQTNQTPLTLSTPAASDSKLRLKGDLLLLLTAIIWGSAFVVQRVAAPSAGVFLFNGTRFLLAAIVLLPLTRLQWKLNRQQLGWAALAGTLLFVASALQQAGLMTTSAGNAGFITGLYVVIVPLLMVVLWKERLRWNAWVAAVLAAVGIFYLSAGGSLQLARGDALELVGAFVWALHVMLLGRVAKRVNLVQFSAAQFLACGLLHLSAGFLLEQARWQAILDSGWAIAYTGIFSVGVGFTLQVFGQRYAPPNDAALILSLEAVCAALGGFIFLEERFVGVQWLGCFLVLAAILLAQLPPDFRFPW
ncbi:MAG: DMT family transporter, partial [Anaerolineaceae bacterium]|nr:DMT family transporter [Anaerolineaceae bacterium]